MSQNTDTPKGYDMSGAVTCRDHDGCVVIFRSLGTGRPTPMHFPNGK